MIKNYYRDHGHCLKTKFQVVIVLKDDLCDIKCDLLWSKYTFDNLWSQQTTNTQIKFKYLIMLNQ